MAKKKANPDVRKFIDWFFKQYQQHLGRKYIVSGGKEGTLVKRLLEQMTLAELKEAAVCMFTDDWARQFEIASIGLLSSQINTWRRTKTPQAQAMESARVGTKAMARVRAAKAAQARIGGMTGPVADKGDVYDKKKRAEGVLAVKQQAKQMRDEIERKKRKESQK